MGFSSLLGTNYSDSDSEPCSRAGGGVTTSSSESSESSSRLHLQSPSRSSGSDKTDSARSDRTLEKLQELEKRRARTAKARAAAIATKTTRRLARKAVLQPPQHPAGDFKDDIKANNSLAHPQANRFRRIRLLVSYLASWGRALVNFFLQVQSTEDTDICHVVTTCILDDTNMRLASQAPGIHQWKMSRVVTVMNCVQNLVISFTTKSSSPSQESAGIKTGYKVFPVFTPPAALPKADRFGIASECVSRLCICFGDISSRFEALSVPRELMHNVPIQALSLCFDSLVTNIAVLKQLRIATDAKHQQAGNERLYPLIAFCCTVHQIALRRKPLLQSWPGFWSSIVRLSHLFEVHSFRVHFRAALLEEICSCFKYVAVCQLPRESDHWKGLRRQICGLVTDQATGFHKKRLQIHLELMQYDNNDPDATNLVHYCTGQCCTGSNQKTKAKFARMQICKLYLLLFSYGYPVPLLYRWVHAHRALRYCRESGLAMHPCSIVFFSKCLPKTVSESKAYRHSHST